MCISVCWFKVYWALKKLIDCQKRRNDIKQPIIKSSKHDSYIPAQHHVFWLPLVSFLPLATAVGALTCLHNL